MLLVAPLDAAFVSGINSIGMVPLLAMVKEFACKCFLVVIFTLDVSYASTCEIFGGLSGARRFCVSFLF